MGDNFLNCSIGLLIPFVGTSLGAACVFFMKNNMKEMTTRALTGFAAGVMVAASIWSLLIPAMEQTQSQGMGKMSFFPAFIGFWIGILFLLFLDNAVPHLHMNSSKSEGPKSSLGKTQMMVLAVTIHNIPEGMAVGVVYAGYLLGNSQITLMGALALSIGKSCWYGILSGAVEPVAAAFTILLSKFIVPAMPYLLSFAAGAMIYVVIEELIPEMSEGKHSNIGTIAFAVGFSIMMTLDVVLG